MAMILTSDHKEEEQSRNTVKKAKRYNSNSSSIDDLTDELLVEILLRVPCKPTFRCKSVSKRWLALISDPYFTHSFLRHHTNKQPGPWVFVINFYLKELFIISQHPEFSFQLSLSFLPCFQTSQVKEKSCIVGSSNGLLLCCTRRHCESIYYVCNPLTKHWVVLPPAPTSPKKVLVGIIYDPVDYNSSASSKCSFKVVRLSTLPGKRSALKVETFLSQTGQWTNSVVPCPWCSANDFISSKTAIEYNGRLHWHLKRHGRFWEFVLVYCPCDDKVTIIDFPISAFIHGEFFGVSRGRLRLAQLQSKRFSDEDPCLIIWELKDYNAGKWCLEHQIHFNDLIWKNNSPPPNWEPKPPKGHIPSMLAFHPCADVIYLGFSQCFASCDLPTKISTEYPYKLPRGANRRHGFTLELLPPWPTPVPALPN